MNMNFGLQQVQTQKLVMTQELRQAISILQYSSLELLEYLHQQASENPLIDVKSLDRMHEGVTESAPAKDQGVKEMDWDEYIRYRVSGYDSGYFYDRDTEDNPIERISCKRRHTMEQDLKEQLNFMDDVDELVKKISCYLIGNLNEQGYLEMDIEEASRRLNVPADRVEEAMHVLQRCEPAGIGARNLVECLTLQLQRNGEENPIVYEIVEHHLEDLAANRYQKVASKFKLEPEEVQDVFDRIRELNPRPGSLFHQDHPRYIVPDVTVEKVDGEYVVLVNEQSAPRLSINRYYESILQKQGENEDARRFIHDKLNAAMWLIRSLEQRRMTLYRVTEAIVRVQRGFFERGVSALQPLTLKQIAEELELHESTISRTTNNKYVQTPRGVFELKYFFTSGIHTQDGSSMSSESIKVMMKQFIEKEDKKKPLSDQLLTDKLKKQGIAISRRTVAKYREELNIPPSSRRKRLG